MTYQLEIERKEGRLTEKAREDLGKQFACLPDGVYKLVLESKSDNYRSTRYKYYFAHLLQTILLTCGDRFQVLDGTEFRPVRDTTEIHAALKMKYNPIIIMSPLGAFTVPSSTTSLSDRDFIARFEQEIQAEFSGPPWNCEFMSRQEYGQFMSRR
jgi:hypothetical protein